ncbi:la protein homolog isoform X2 [Cataglyphis hispanica]|uniref:la protein homolog isoform X2 n=1 Tax=Cataglyphis hispanica TaxID=1086592 RepID=UPI0021808960|nr:la protein homolog isoform X2 [Cataglyphis hispanica]
MPDSRCATCQIVIEGITVENCDMRFSTVITCIVIPFITVWRVVRCVLCVVPVVHRALRIWYYILYCKSNIVDMENDRKKTNADCLIGDAANKINKMTIIDAESKNTVKAMPKISEKINAKVEVSKTVSMDNASKKAEEKPPAELLKKIKDQVEYYFGNVNMQKDKFLIEQIKLDAGWIPMTVMLKFRMLANFSRNVDVILKALENSNLIEISKDRKKIRRSPNYPLPEYNEECRKAQEARTIYVTGFPLNSNIDKLKAFFESYQPFERIMELLLYSLKLWMVQKLL